MPSANHPDVYIWGLDINRMPIALVRLDVAIEPDGVSYLYEIPDELFNNPDVYYAFPEDVIF